MSQQIANEIRSEIASILRRKREVGKPLSNFGEVESKPIGSPQFYVLFDQNPRLVINGLIWGGAKEIRVPDSRILDEVFAYAKSVWHLKDRLKAYVRSQRLAIDIEALADGSHDLLICADLANWKKHGANRNRSGINPRIELVTFDTSRNGQLEMYYDGATQQKELLVEINEPIPVRVELIADGGKGLDDVIPLIWRAFEQWIPTIKRIGVLNGADRRVAHLRQELSA